MSKSVDPSIDSNQVRRDSKTSSSSTGSSSTEDEDILPSNQGKKLSSIVLGGKTSNKSDGKLSPFFINEYILLFQEVDEHIKFLI